MTDHVDQAQKALRGSGKDAWFAWVRKNAPGISIAKAGFLAAMLGRGDIATADARELRFWGCPATAWSIEKRRCSQHVEADEDDVDRATVDAIGTRLRELKISVPEAYKPFYTHLAHHTVWDAAYGTETTHEAVVRALEDA